MCSLMGFGELNIPSSRAFWDDCDEEGEEDAQKTPEKLQLTFEAGKENTLNTSELFVLVEGLHISEFAQKTLLKDAIKVCTIPAKNSALYYVERKQMYIAILEEDLTNSGELTELLLPYAKAAKNVSTLNVKSKVDYKSEHIAKVREEITFLRGINAQLKNVPELKTPNFIAGVTAGVASWRENAHLPVSSYVAYTDKIEMDTLAAKPVLKLLQDLGVDVPASYTAKQKDDSHLYS